MATHTIKAGIAPNVDAHIAVLRRIIANPQSTREDILTFVNVIALSALLQGEGVNDITDYKLVAVHSDDERIDLSPEAIRQLTQADPDDLYAGYAANMTDEQLREVADLVTHDDGIWQQVHHSVEFAINEVVRRHHIPNANDPLEDTA
jgi:hypothetical protein